MSKFQESAFNTVAFEKSLVKFKSCSKNVTENCYGQSDAHTNVQQYTPSPPVYNYPIDVFIINNKKGQHDFVLNHFNFIITYNKLKMIYCALYIL